MIELIDWATIAIIISAGAAAVGIGIAVYNTKSTKKQIECQNRINSALLSLELIKRVRDSDFVEIVDKIFDNESSKCDPNTLERFLNHLDMMARFHEDGIVSMTHIRQIYRGMLERIIEDDHIQNKLTENPRLYKPLKRLCDKI